MVSGPKSLGLIPRWTLDGERENLGFQWNRSIQKKCRHVHPVSNWELTTQNLKVPSVTWSYCTIHVSYNLKAWWKIPSSMAGQIPTVEKESSYVYSIKVPSHQRIHYNGSPLLDMQKGEEGTTWILISGYKIRELTPKRLQVHEKHPTFLKETNRNTEDYIDRLT